MADSPALYESALQTGRLSLSAGRWLDAADAFRIAIRNNPQGAEGHAGLGDAMLGAGRPDRALDCFKTAGRLSGGSYDYLLKVADVQERLGQLSEAARTYLAAGEIFFRRDQLEEAIANWRRAVRVEPGLLGAHLRLATALHRRDEVKAAVREYLAVARVLQLRGELDRALQVCRAAQAIAPDDPDIKLAMRLLRGEGLEDEQPPAPLPERLHAVEGANPQPAWREADDRLLPVSKPDTMPTSLVEARRRAQDRLAEEIFRDEDAGQPAEEASRRLSKLERDALIGQGMDYQMRGRLKDAIDCYQRTIAGGLELPAAYFTVGMLCMDLHRYEEAAPLLRRAAEEATLQEPVALALAIMPSAI